MSSFWPSEDLGYVSCLIRVFSSGATPHHSPMSLKWESPPTRENPFAVASPNQIFILSHQRFIPPLDNQITIFILEPHKDFIFSCSHCSCTIFILNLQSLYIQVMLILILIDVQYFQNLVFSFEKGSNVQYHFSGFCFFNKKN